MHLKPTIRRRIILLLSLLIAVAGLLSVVLPSGGHTDVYGDPANVHYTPHFLLSPMHVSLFGAGLKFGTNYLNAFFYVLLLIGTFLFLFNPKEIRLIRCISGIILFDRAAGYLASLLARIKEVDGEVVWDTTGFQVDSIFSFIAILITISLLVEVQKYRRLLIPKRPVAAPLGVEVSRYVNAGIDSRFFHMIIDGILTITIFFQLGDIFATPIWNYTTAAIGYSATAWVHFIALRIVYFLFFEAIWKATPAKFLTQSRVTNVQGEKITLKQALARTLSRWVPFEAFSFLGAGARLHDLWSQTHVLKEAPAE